MTEDHSERRRDLLATRKMLVETARDHADEGVRERAKILIQNIDGMQRDPDDTALQTQFALNFRDFNRRIADYRGRGS
jgi:hypothetical protein